MLPSSGVRDVTGAQVDDVSVEAGGVVSMDNLAAGEAKAPAEAEVASIYNLYATVYSFNMFTITDGAIRVIILLHANNLGFTPIQIALMFTLYEVAGVVTNLFGGIAATRYGLKATLFTSVVLQIMGLTLLMLVNPIFGATDASVPADKRVQITVYITLCQMLSGISKDFMKISCKTVPKLVTKADANDQLFKLVAVVTGLKNTLKGVGAILGAILVQFAGFEAAIGVLLGVVVLIIPVPLRWMEPTLGKGSRKTAQFSWAIFQKSANVNWLSLARVFLFGSRDTWFEIAAPIFLRGVLGWPAFSVGLFMGGYIIVYGNIQTATTQLYKTKKHVESSPSGEVSAPAKRGRCGCCGSCCKCSGFDGPPTEKHVPGWAFANAVQLLVWGSIMYPLYREFVAQNETGPLQAALGAVLIAGLFAFAFLFAVNSSVHSYLIVLYSGKDKAAMDLGFYYMANAMGRLVGTMASGVIYQFTEEQFGLSMCLWVASVFMVIAGVVAFKLEPVEKLAAV